MGFKGVVFDLDGTLVNSIEDISDSMNLVLRDAGFEEYNYKTYETFIGNGIRSLVIKALPDSVTSESEIDLYFNKMLTVYAENCTNKTAPYDGILELLEKLVEKRIVLSVLSNKADALTKMAVKKKLPNIFSPVIGLTTEALKKPNPNTLLEICKTIGLNKDEVLFVGDTSVDIQTAKNAGMKVAAVTWGFRSKEDLLKESPDFLVDTPDALMDLL